MTIGVDENDIFCPLPAVVLRGLLSMLPLVQHFPEDRFIHIELGSNDGACLLVVWAHHVLDLTVKVRTYKNDECTTSEFGSGSAQLVIDARSVVNWTIREPSITLLENVPGTPEELLRLVPDPDETKVEAVHTAPLKGYGTAVVKDIISDQHGIKAPLLDEMKCLTCGFALAVSKHLVMADDKPEQPPSPSESSSRSWTDTDGSDAAPDKQEVSPEPASGTDNPDLYPISIPESRVISAAELVFGAVKLDKGSVFRYSKLFAKDGLDRKSEPPHWVSEIFRTAKGSNAPDGVWLKKALWPSLAKTTKHLSVLILALAHAHELEFGASLRLSFQCDRICRHPLAQHLLARPGVDKIPVTETTWYHAMATLMTTHDLKTDINSPCLVSDRGWSVYIASLVQPTRDDLIQIRDPSFIRPGFFVVQRGVPCRNGVRKHFIFDGPDTGRLDVFDWQRLEAEGDRASLRCADKVALGWPLYGEKNDSFIVTLRLDSNADGKTYTRRTGYSELYTAIWMIRKTVPCDHAFESKERLKLPPGCSTVGSFGDRDGLVDERADLEFLDHERVVICLTANNSAARWRALVAIAYSRIHVSGKAISPRACLLRGPDCCFKCSLSQTAQLPRCFLVL